MRRLQNYSHTSSKEIIIKVELAKLYLSQDINDNKKATEYLRDIKKELEQFKLDDLEKMLPEAETKDLSIQIAETLERLNHLRIVEGIYNIQVHHARKQFAWFNF